MTFRMPKSACLDCGKQMDGASSLQDGRGPQDGDITVCLYCGHIMAFTADQKLRELTPAEMHEVAGDPAVLDVQRFRAAYKKAYP